MFGRRRSRRLWGHIHRTAGADLCEKPFLSGQGATCEDQHPLTDDEKKDGRKMYVPSLHVLRPAAGMEPSVVQPCCILIDKAEATTYFTKLWTQYEEAAKEMAQHQQYMQKDLQTLFALEQKASDTQAYEKLGEQELHDMYVETWDLHDLADKQWTAMEQARLFWAKIEKEFKQTTIDDDDGPTTDGATSDADGLSKGIYRMVASAYAGIIRDLDKAELQYRTAAAKVRFRFMRMNSEWFTAQEQQQIRDESGFDPPSKWRQVASAVGKGITRLATATWQKVKSLFSLLKNRWFWATFALGIVLLYFVGLGTVTTFVTSVLQTASTALFGSTTLEVWNALKWFGGLCCSIALCRPVLLFLLWSGWLFKLVVVLWKLPLIRAGFAALGALFDTLIGLIPGLGTIWLALRRFLDPVKTIEHIVKQIYDRTTQEYRDAQKSTESNVRQYAAGIMATYAVVFAVSTVLAPFIQQFGDTACTWASVAGDAAVTALQASETMVSVANIVGQAASTSWSWLNQGFVQFNQLLKSAGDAIGSLNYNTLVGNGLPNNVSSMWQSFVTEHASLWQPIVDLAKKMIASIIEFFDTHTRRMFMTRLLRAMSWIDDHLDWLSPLTYNSPIKAVREAIKVMSSRRKWLNKSIDSLTSVAGSDNVSTNLVTELLDEYQTRFGLALDLTALRTRWTRKSYAAQDVTNLTRLLTESKATVDVEFASAKKLLDSLQVHPDWLDRIWHGFRRFMQDRPLVFWGGLSGIVMFVVVSLMTNELAPNRLYTGAFSILPSWAEVVTPKKQENDESSSELSLPSLHAQDAESVAADWAYVEHRHPAFKRRGEFTLSELQPVFSQAKRRSTSLIDTNTIPTPL